MASVTWRIQVTPAFREGGRKGATIAENFIIAKDICTYKIIILRQDKSLRDQAPPRWIGRLLWDVSDERWAWDETSHARAQTSKPVLYRRWKTREDLLRATARHRGAADPPAVPDTGTLRGDLLALLSYANTTRNPMVALVSSMLGSYYNQTMSLTLPGCSSGMSR